MKLTLRSENSLRFEPDDGALTIEAASPDLSYSPFHMLASLAYCTFSVLYAWAENAGLQANDVVLDVGWEFADDPHRVGRIDLRFTWPSLPANRMAAAERVAELCTIHATLLHPPAITISGSRTQAP
jgi:uncharacterized OsmC-like protein